MQPFAWPPTSKTQKRANALKNITIPRYETLTRDIQNALEEKEREEFTKTEGDQTNETECCVKNPMQNFSGFKLYPLT